ncbi:NUDIX hydrolase [Craurococcus roseus]|uniref:NUDIX hydrolase n=1 Tax=Craurococcus roseus TaxID=77585 RepID=UPI0031DB7C11
MAKARERAAKRRTSCGVVVTDGALVLLGRFARRELWDIPKGVAEPGEAFADAAARELEEETGLQAPPGALRDLGVHRYLRGKDLALFLWRVDAMPAAEGLRCTSVFRAADGSWLPEFDRFAVLPWAEALPRVGRNLQRVLGEVRTGPGWPFPPLAGPRA